MKLLVEGVGMKLDNKRTYLPLASPSEGKQPSQYWLYVYTLSVPTHKCNEIYVNKIKNRKWQCKYKKSFLCVCVFF